MDSGASLQEDFPLSYSQELKKMENYQPNDSFAEEFRVFIPPDNIYK